MKEMEERYRKYLDKARSVCSCYRYVIVLGKQQSILMVCITYIKVN